MTAPQLASGAVVAGKYSIVSCIGYSGAAATYHAVTADRRDVVLKIFDPAIRQRADIMSAIEQVYASTNALPPDVVAPVLDAGYDPGTGAPFGVTERLTFPSIAQLVTQRPLTPEETSMALVQLGRALDAAHARGLAHHALKPTNVFVQGYGTRITDFGAGLARIAVPTAEGYALAAPWLAPEQVLGTQAGPAADVFAAGLVAFFALTGRSYWRSCQGQPDLTTWQRELMAPRTAPSVRAAELGATLSPAFDGVIGSALSVDPAHRFRSVGEFASAIDTLVSVKNPDAAATMAFPAADPALGGYPPAPSPAAGTLPYGAQSAQQQSLAPPPGAPGGAYVAAQPPSARTDELPVESIVPPPSKSKAVPILVGVVAVLLLGGGAAWFFTRPTAGPATASSASPTGTDAASATSAAAAATATAAATAAEPAGSAVPAASAGADAGAAGVEVSLSCDPACEELKVDGKPVDVSAPLTLPAGKHVVTGAAAGYASVKDTITVVDGKKFEKQWKLVAKAAGPAAGVGVLPVGGPGPTPKAPAPCGKFLKNKCK